MGGKVTYKAEVKVLVIDNMELLHEILTKSKRLVHWLDQGQEGLIQMLLNSDYKFFSLVSGDKLLGLTWVYSLDLDNKSMKCGVLVWERIRNFQELLTLCFEVFGLEKLYAIVDKIDNRVCERLLTKLGFINQGGGEWVANRVLLQKTL